MNITLDFEKTLESIVTSFSHNWHYSVDKSDPNFDYVVKMAHSWIYVWIDKPINKALIKEYYETKKYFELYQCNIPLFFAFDSNNIYDGISAITKACETSVDESYIEPYYESFKAIQRSLNYKNNPELKQITEKEFNEMDFFEFMKDRLRTQLLK